MDSKIRAALNPPIFRKLYNCGFVDRSRFEIIEFLTKNGFSDSGASTCARSFISTMEYVGLR
jgi:hypothetical protein